MPLAGIEQELRTLAGQIAATECRFLCLLADFDTREGWGAWVGIRSCAHWLSWQCGLDLRTARQYLQVARNLPGLPLLRDEFAAGRLSYSKVRAIARVGTPQNEADLVRAALRAPAAQIERLTRGLQTAKANGCHPNDDSSPKDGSSKERSTRERLGLRWHWDNDGTLAVWGRLSSDDGARLLAATVRAENERRRTHEPPSQSTSESRPPSPGEPSEPSSLPKSSPSAQPSRASATVVTTPPSDLGPAVAAMAEMICAGLPAPTHAPGADVIISVDADTFIAALTEPTSPPPTTAGPHDEPAPPCCDHQCHNGPPTTPDTETETETTPAQTAGTKTSRETTSETTSEASAQRAGSCVTQPAEDPSHTPSRPAWQIGAHLQDGPALHAATLRRLADDGRLRTEVTSSDGRTLNLGRTRRTVSNRQFLILWRRDHGCTVPGCGRIRFLHAHHVVFWTQGGATDLDNLLLLCGEHHRALHEGDFSIRALGRQQFSFHTRNGSHYQASPPIHGRVSDLTDTHPDITDQTIVPDWDGNPLSLHWAVGSYLGTWTAERRRAAQQPQTAQQQRAAEPPTDEKAA